MDAEIFNMPLIDVEDFSKLIFRFAINTVMIVILVRYLYYATTKRKDYLFTYFLISFIVFLLCYLLENVKLADKNTCLLNVYWISKIYILYQTPYC